MLVRFYAKQLWWFIPDKHFYALAVRSEAFVERFYFLFSVADDTRQHSREQICLQTCELRVFCFLTCNAIESRWELVDSTARCCTHRVLQRAIAGNLSDDKIIQGQSCIRFWIGTLEKTMSFQLKHSFWTRLLLV